MAFGGADVWSAARHPAGRFLFSVYLWQSGLEAGGERVHRRSAARRMPAGVRHIHLDPDPKSDRGGRHRIWACAGSVDFELDYFVRKYGGDPGSELSLDRQPYGQLLPRRDRHERPDLLRLHDFPWIVFNGSVARVAAVEGITWPTKKRFPERAPSPPARRASAPRPPCTRLLSSRSWCW